MLSDIIVRNTGFIIHRFCSDVRTIALVFLPTINIAQIMLLKSFIHEITTCTFITCFDDMLPQFDCR